MESNHCQEYQHHHHQDGGVNRRLKQHSQGLGYQKDEKTEFHRLFPPPPYLHRSSFPSVLQLCGSDFLSQDSLHQQMVFLDLQLSPRLSQGAKTEELRGRVRRARRTKRAWRA